MAYRILLGLDAAAFALAGFFFLWGVSDGTVSAFNILEWTLLLGGLGGVVLGGMALHRAGRPAIAKALLALLAAPVTMAGVLVLVLIAAPVRWN
jgi:hypothetical protein